MIRILLALLVTVLSLPAPRAAAAEPAIVVAEPVHRFAVVVRGAVVEHEFALRNDGTVPVRIGGFRMTAPLRAAGVVPTIAPGATGRLRVLLDTRTLTGTFDGEVLVSFAGGAVPDLRLALMGRVAPPVEVVPMAAVFLTAVRGAAPAVKSVEIVNHEETPLAIRTIAHAEGRITTALDTLEAGRRYRLTVRFAPAGPGGKRTDTILVETTSAATPVLRIMAHTHLRERVSVFPDSLDVGHVARGPGPAAAPMPPPAATLMVYGPPGGDLRVPVRTEPPLFDLLTARAPGGDRYQITVFVRSDVPAGEVDGTLVVETNDPDVPRLRVPVTAVVHDVADRRGADQPPVAPSR